MFSSKKETRGHYGSILEEQQDLKITRVHFIFWKVLEDCGKRFSPTLPG